MAVIKALSNIVFIPLFFWIAWVNAEIIVAVSETVELNAANPNFVHTLEGVSGGSVDSQGCGFVPNSPHHVLKINQRIDYLSLSIESGSDSATLLVKGSDGKLCSLSDSTVGVKPEIAGVWMPGTYYVYVGDLSGQKNPFTLRISGKKIK